jgi:hypoxanthine phosphoribosyltransferase
MGNGELRRLISWDEYNELVSHIAAQIGDDVPDVVVGLTRGGLVPAVQLSHMFNVPLIPLNISLRDRKCADVPFDYKQIEQYHHPLVVDDINDSGSTLRKVLEMIGPFPGSFAALLSKDSSEFECTYSGELINTHKDNEWIVFPWE